MQTHPLTIQLSPDGLAKVDALAALAGVTHEALIESIVTDVISRVPESVKAPGPEYKARIDTLIKGFHGMCAALLGRMESTRGLNRDELFQSLEPFQASLTSTTNELERQTASTKFDYLHPLQPVIALCANLRTSAMTLNLKTFQEKVLFHICVALNLVSAHRGEEVPEIFSHQNLLRTRLTIAGRADY